MKETAMTLRHLKIFVTVCETGSATAAGEKLFLAQPAVSLAISELENYYGIKLFDRIAKRLYITEAGKYFLQYATHIVGSFEEMEKQVKNYDNIGIIRVGTSITIGNYLLPQYVTAFKKIHPQMQVKAIIDNSDKIQQYVYENKVDLGFIEGIIHNHYLIAQTFQDDELIMICSNDHRFANKSDIDISELQDQPLLLREVGSAGRELFDSVLTAHGMEVAPIWESISTQAILKAVQANLGISVLPYLLVKDSLDRKEISKFQLKDISFKRHFSIIYHKNKFMTQSAKDMIAVCNQMKTADQ